MAKPSLYQQIAETIRQDILQQNLRPGDRQLLAKQQQRKSQAGQQTGNKCFSFHSSPLFAFQLKPQNRRTADFVK